MKRTLLIIGIALAVAQLAIGLVAWGAAVFSASLLATQMITTGLLLWLAARWLQPLKPLEQLLETVGRPATRTPLLGSLFSRTRELLLLRERQLEEQNRLLAENRERFQAVLSGMTEGVIAVGQGGELLLLNRAARRILSVDLEDVIGRPLIGIVRYEAVRNAVQEAVETQNFVDVTFQTFGLEPRDVRLRVAPMAGTPSPGLTLVFHDVTELTRLETIRRDFVANVSHELKTPLSSIKAYAETLLMGAIDKAPDNVRFIKQIEQQADTLGAQIHDLLQLAKIESGRKVFAAQQIDLMEVCRQSIKAHADEAARKRVQLALRPSNIAAGDRTVWADAEALRTIFDNLVSNALRYSHHHGSGSRPAGVEVALRTAGDHVVVEVIDNGIGIAPEHQTRVFERFFRVDAARSRELGGTGLGLAIVKHLTQAMGGRIELQSKVGVGTTVHIHFPVFR